MKLEIREDGKARIVCGRMATHWFKNQDNALQWIGRNLLKHGPEWVAKLKWRERK